MRFLVVLFLSGGILLSAGSGVRAREDWDVAVGAAVSHDTEQDMDFRTVIVRKRYPLYDRWARGRVWFGLEFNVGTVELETDDGYEVGLTPALLYAFPVGSRSRFTVEVGVGGLYTDAEVPEYGQDFNFTPQIGIGFQWFLGGGAGPPINLWYRLRHASNAGLARPNGGVDAGYVFIGTSF